MVSYLDLIFIIITIMISFLKVVFLNSIIYQNCVTDNDCRYWEFYVVGTNLGPINWCGSGSKSLYMGPYGLKTSIYKTVSNVAPNKLIEFSLGIWKIDSWDWEGFEIYANNKLIENLKIGASDGYP